MKLGVTKSQTSLAAVDCVDLYLNAILQWQRFFMQIQSPKIQPTVCLNWSQATSQVRYSKRSRVSIMTAWPVCRVQLYSSEATSVSCISWLNPLFLICFPLFQLNSLAAQSSGVSTSTVDSNVANIQRTTLMRECCSNPYLILNSTCVRMLIETVSRWAGMACLSWNSQYLSEP